MGGLGVEGVDVVNRLGWGGGGDLGGPGRKAGVMVLLGWLDGWMVTFVGDLINGPGVRKSELRIGWIPRLCINHVGCYWWGRQSVPAHDDLATFHSFTK